MGLTWSAAAPFAWPAADATRMVAFLLAGQHAQKGSRLLALHTVSPLLMHIYAFMKSPELKGVCFATLRGHNDGVSCVVPVPFRGGGQRQGPSGAGGAGGAVRSFECGGVGVVTASRNNVVSPPLRSPLTLPSAPLSFIHPRW